MIEPQRILYHDSSHFPTGLLALLGGRGYEIEGVRDGDELAERIERDRPALVIASSKMAGVDGLSLCRRVRGDPALNEVAVLVLAAQRENVRNLYSAAGCDGYYEPPFDDIAIAQRIDEILQDRSTARKMSLTRLVIDYRVNADLLLLNPVDLQQETLFVRTNHPLATGARLKLSLSVAGKTLLDAHGEVTRSEPFVGATSRPSGMAVRLHDLDPEGRLFLDALRRQQMFAGRAWGEVPVETLVDRIAVAVSSPAAQPDPLLARAGFDRAKLRPWEAAAFVEAEGADLVVSGALREAVGLSHKISLHMASYRELAYVGPKAFEKISAHSEAALARAEAAADVLGSLAQRAVEEGRQEESKQLATTQADLLQKMVELRTLMGDARRGGELALVTDFDLCPEPEVRALLLGLGELFDFGAVGRKEHADALNPELDLSELSAFEIARLMEARMNATAVDPRVAVWTRALTARAIHMAEFLRYRKPGRETRQDRVDEVIQFTTSTLDSLLRTEDRYRADLEQLVASAVPDLSSLADVYQRTLQVAARLSAYYNQHAPPTAPDYDPRLVQAAEAAAKIVPPSGGQRLAIGLPHEEATRAPAAGPIPAAAPKAAPPTPWLERLGPFGEWIGDFGVKRLAWVLGGVLGAAALATGLYFGVFAGRGGGPEAIDVRPFASILPLSRCEVRTGGTQKKTRTLYCVVRPEWLSKPDEERKSSLQSFQGAVRARKIGADQIVIVDATDYTVGFADGTAVEVYDR